MASDNELRAEYVNGLDGTLKGFHTIEYLLFDEGGSKTPGDFTEQPVRLPRRQHPRPRTDGLRPARQLDSLGRQLRLQGRSEQAAAATSTPPSGPRSRRSSTAMIGICDEVANGKIADPFSEQDPRLVESQFSFNSLEDFQNNMRSVRNALHRGTTTAARGPALDEFVALRNADLDSRLKREIEAAIDEIGRISNPFRDAIASDADQIEKAQQAIARVQQTLQEDVLPLVLE